MQFIDLSKQQSLIKNKINSRIQTVLKHGHYIMGPEVFEFEKNLKVFTGVNEVISCANGTDALTLVLKAWNVSKGDAVYIPSFTYVASAEAACILGATPVFVDVNYSTFNMDYKSLEKSIENSKKLNLTPKAIIPVDLFGQPADYNNIIKIAKEYKIKTLIDSAQSFGASYNGKRVGSFGDACITSFFPAKPLGCYGDGGAVFTNDQELSDIIKSLRFHGKGTDKYDHVKVGMNSRLDTIQSAILLEKLKIFEDEIQKRNEVAKIYSKYLKPIVDIPTIIEGVKSVWAQYTIKHPQRDRLQKFLKKENIPTAIYYPKALSKQEAYNSYRVFHEKKMVSEKLSKCVLSLPMHPYLEKNDQESIISAIEKFHV